MDTKLTRGQCAFLIGMWAFAISAYSLLTAMALGSALHGNRGAWGFVVVFAVMACSAGSMLLMAPPRMRLLNEEGWLIKLRLIDLDQRRRVASSTN